MRCGGTRPVRMSSAVRAVRPDCRSYSGPSWTASSGSGTPSRTPSGHQSVTSTVARSGRLRTASGRALPPPAAGAGALPGDVGGAPEDARLPGRGAGGDVAEAIGGGLNSTGVALVRPVVRPVALDELRVASKLALELDLDLVRRRRGGPAPGDGAGCGERGRHERAPSHASHGPALYPIPEDRKS